MKTGARLQALAAVVSWMFGLATVAALVVAMGGGDHPRPDRVVVRRVVTPTPCITPPGDIYSTNCSSRGTSASVSPTSSGSTTTETPTVVPASGAEGGAVPPEQ